MGAYEDNLRHVAEPASPREREEAVSACLKDYEAIWFAEALREFAHYGGHEHDDQGGVAVAYASYIDKKVRDEGRTFVELYVHTEVAVDTLLDALYEHRPVPNEDDNYPITLFSNVETVLAETLCDVVEDD